MKRKLFCELCPLAYRISVMKCRMVRRLKNIFKPVKLAKMKSDEKLPVTVFEHQSLIRRNLGDNLKQLQENKAVNLSLAAPKVSGVLIRPGEVFSFWKLVGATSKFRGYKDGLIISNSASGSGIGGGMCQFTNLIHWMVLHSPLEITEHHHHDGFDLFPDSGRKVPFGTGTSITYNYLDYRFKNTTNLTFQLIIYVTDTHLCGELRASDKCDTKYRIYTEDECFVKEGSEVYRIGKVYRECMKISGGGVLSKELLRENHARVMYDTSGLEISRAKSKKSNIS